MIPPEYQNQQDITDVMNVILQGENNSSNPDIYKLEWKILLIQFRFHLMSFIQATLEGGQDAK